MCLDRVVSCFEFHRRRSTKSHEIALNFFVVLRVISRIVLPNLREQTLNIEKMTLASIGLPGALMESRGEGNSVAH